MEDRHVEHETLGAYAEGRLTPERAQAVEAHVATCGECVSALAAVGAARELARFAAPLTPRLAERLEKLAPARAGKKRRAASVSSRRGLVSAMPSRSSAPWVRTAVVLVPIAAALLVGLLLLSQSRTDETAPGGGVAQVPRPERSPAPAPTPSPSPRASVPSPRPEASPEPGTPEPTPGPGVEPAPGETPSPSSEPSPEPRPESSPGAPDSGTASRPEAPPAPGARPVAIELAQGTCTLAKKALRVGEHVTANPGDELVASGGARVLLGRSELALKGSLSLEETTEGERALVAVRVRSGDALLSVPAALEGSASPAFEVRAGSLRGRPQGGGHARVFCSLVSDRATVGAVEGEVKVGDQDGALAVDLATGQQVTAPRGTRVATVRPEAMRGRPWIQKLAPREVVLYSATFEASPDGWDEEVRVSPGFGGSRFGLEAVPSSPGKPWYFLALRTRLLPDPALHAIRFRWKTPAPVHALMVTVLRAGSTEKLVATVRPPSTKDTWALFDVRLSDFQRLPGGDASDIGADRKGKVILSHGDDGDPVPAAFVIDDFEIVERGR